MAAQDLGADGNSLWGGLVTVPPVKKAPPPVEPFPSKFLSSRIYNPGFSPHMITPQDFPFPDESISLHFLSAPPLHLTEFSLHMVGTQRVLTCYLNNWWRAPARVLSLRLEGCPQTDPVCQPALSIASHWCCVLCSSLGLSSIFSQSSTFE